MSIATITVDHQAFSTSYTKDSAGFDLDFFGEGNCWSDGKHYAGIMKCLLECFDNGVKEYSIVRKGSEYSVSLG
jgi:hypothetical protein